MYWKLCEMKVVFGDGIRPLLCLYAYMNARVEEFLLWSCLLQDGLASLKGHGSCIGYPHHFCVTLFLFGIATLWRVQLWQPSKLIFGCEVTIPSSPPAFLLFALRVWLVSPIFELLWTIKGGVFYQIDDFSLIVSNLKYTTPDMGQYHHLQS